MGKMKTSEIKALGFKRVEGIGWVLDCPFTDMPKQEGSTMAPYIYLDAHDNCIHLNLFAKSRIGWVDWKTTVTKPNYSKAGDIIRSMYDAWKAVAS